MKVSKERIRELNALGIQLSMVVSHIKAFKAKDEEESSFRNSYIKNLYEAYIELLKSVEVEDIECEQCGSASMTCSFCECGTEHTRNGTKYSLSTLRKAIKEAEMKEIHNGIIEKADVGFDGDWLFTYHLQLRGAGTGCIFGGHCLGKRMENKFYFDSRSIVALMKILDVVGADNFKELEGKPIRIMEENCSVIGIGNFLEDKWFIPREFFAVKKDWEVLEDDNNSGTKVDENLW